MTLTLNLSDTEARSLHHLVENELHSQAVQELDDSEYKDSLRHLLEKLERRNRA